MSDWLSILAVLALVGVNAFLVVGEYAVVTARRAALAVRAEEGSAGARAALRLMDDPVRVISTVQVGITAVGILIGAIGEPLVADLLGVPGWLGFALAFGVVTYLSVVLGELVPKALTLDRAEALASVVARPIELVEAALRPLVWVLQGSATLLLRPFGVREVVAGSSIRTAGELQEIVDEAEDTGIIPRAQEEMLHNVFEFADLEARDIMIPAPEVHWLEAEMTPDAALDRVVSTPHERYPVASGSLSRLLGVVHVRDLVAASRGGGGSSVAELARPALVVPETKDLGPLLREQRELREQLAIVVDEYGATVGIVSIEDVLEQLVGEIEDEYDLPDATLERLDSRTVQVAGSMTIDDFNEAVGTRLPIGETRTLAGLAFDRLGRQPREGDMVRVEGAELRVDEVDHARITRLRIRLPEAESGS